MPCPSRLHEGAPLTIALIIENLHKLFARDRLFLEKESGGLVHLVQIIPNDLSCFIVCFIDDAVHLFIDIGRRFVGASQGSIPTQVRVVHRLQCHHPVLIAHPVTSDHGSCHLSSPLDVVRCAPEDPAVARATRSISISSCCTFCKCTLNIAFRPCRSGNSICIRRSNRPGRSNALSRLSGRLVAASITTPFRPSKPSISVSSWFKVCSRSSLLLILSRFLPMASISSIKIMQGAFSVACLNRSRTLAAPIPTNICTNSDPEMEKKNTFASSCPATSAKVVSISESA